MHARKLPRISESSFDQDYGSGTSASTSKVPKIGIIGNRNYWDRRRVSSSEKGTNTMLL